MAHKPVVLPLFANEALFTLDGKSVQFQPAPEPSGFRITMAKLVDQDSVNHKPIENGLYDYHLGPAIAGEICKLCERKCEGHPGYIQLPEPVYKGPFMDDAKKLLVLLCPNGHGIKDSEKVLFILKHLEGKTAFDKSENERIIRNQLTGRYCRMCHELFKGVRKPKLAPHKILLNIGKKNEDSTKARDLKVKENYEFLASDFEKVYNRDIYLMHKEIFDKIHGGYVEFTTRRVSVLPSTCRPLNKVKGEWTANDPFNDDYKKLLRTSNEIEDLQKKPNRTKEDLILYGYKVLDLQKSMCSLWEKVKLKLNKKEGMIRSNILGKRVDHCARSVITPDSYIDVDEVGIPRAIAQKLEISMSITPQNYSDVLRLIDSRNAHYVQFEDGSKKNVSKALQTSVDPIKQKIRNPVDFVEQPFVENALQVVVRPLLDGDIVLVNRQPSLHKASMMAHRVRIIHDSNYTLRLHVGACKPYNADFDGDEMNIHVPQTLSAQNEARILASIKGQYFSQRDGSPQIGLIQDHVVAALNLTMRNTFLTEDAAQGLLASEAVKIRSFEMPVPAILKAPKLKTPLYTGKQLISALVKNCLRDNAERNEEQVEYFNMTSKAKVDALLLFDGDKEKLAISDEIHPGDHKMRDNEVIFREGELCVGVIDKNQIGTEKFGLIHTLFWLYSSTVACRIVSALGRVFDGFLMRHGFSVSTSDVMLEPVTGAKMKHALSKTEKKHIVCLGEELVIPVGKKKTNHRKMREEIRRIYSEANQKNEFEVLEKIKAVGINTGKALTEVMKMAKPATIFPDNNFSMMIKTGAKGSQVNHNQLAYYVGQMDINGAPPPRMINGQILHNVDPWDPSMKSNGFVMNSYASGLDPTEIVFTTMAGRSGLVDTSVKTATSGYLQRALMKKLEDLTIHHDGSIRDAANRLVQVLYGSDGIDASKSNTLYHENNLKLIADNLHVYKNRLSRIPDKAAASQKKKLNKMRKRAKREERENGDSRPLLHYVPPFSCLGATSDEFKAKVKKFIDERISSPEMKESFARTMDLLFRMSAAEPGDPVGVVAAHSIGEPSTQMTLNTFHLAGSSDVNITMGLPRLRQLLQFGKVVQSNVNIPVSPDLSQRKIEKLQRSLLVIRMIDFVKNFVFEGTRRGEVDHRIMEMELVEEYEEFGATEEIFQSFAHRLTRKIPYEIEKFKVLVQKKKRIRLDKIKNVVRRPVQEEGREETGLEEEDEDKEAEEADYEDELEDTIGAGQPRAKSLKSPGQVKLKWKNIGPEHLNPNIDPETYILPTYLDARAHFECIVDNKARYHIWSRPSQIDVALLLQCVEKEAELMCIKNEHLRHLTCRWVARKGEEGLPERIQLQLSGHIDKLKDPVVKVLKENQGKFDASLMDVDSPTLAVEFFGKCVAKDIMAREVQKVFNFYGISVDPRHLALVSEYLTIHGDMKGAHRANYKYDEPLQAASFEQGSAEFVHNVMRRGTDRLVNSSARHFVGLPPKTGTGSVTVIQKLPKIDFSDTDWA
ncbi:uncharacterized protein LOC136042160 [Artemia franciscana]|uniref:uncharacterized protein LOC136042160 n=1 Tax=Artemia franciscana TaxID=6661 RepID=UPI0032DAD2E0